MERYFAPIQQVYDYIGTKAQGKVLELGPGENFFPGATEFGGHLPKEAASYASFKKFDFCEDRFPYEDKEIDFLVARHVIEDLYNPIHFLNECRRIAKAGYFETPSPFIETQKGIEKDDSVLTGYHHHHSFVWTQNNKLNILHKFPMVDHLKIKIPNKAEVIKDPFAWNNYFLWEGNFEILHWRHEVNYLTTKDYPRLVSEAINRSFDHTQKFKKEIADAS